MKVQFETDSQMRSKLLPRVLRKQKFWQIKSNLSTLISQFKFHTLHIIYNTFDIFSKFFNSPNDFMISVHGLNTKAKKSTGWKIQIVGNKTLKTLVNL
jgi:hypothetical protein